MREGSWVQAGQSAGDDGWAPAEVSRGLVVSLVVVRCGKAE